MNLVYLTNEQTGAFEGDNHREEAILAKYEVIARRFPAGPATILDLGGGAGTFADRLLARYPSAIVTILDCSDRLLAANRQHPRKRLIRASVSDLDAVLRSERFDVITLNFLLHHLVGPDYRTCRTNCVQTLRACTNLLSEHGVILVAEHAFAGPFGINIPSRIIFELTRIRTPALVRLIKPYFNTAGTGVCFRSSRDWAGVFRESGLSCEPIFDMPWTLGSISRRVKFAALGLTSPAQRHFACFPRQGPPGHRFQPVSR